MRAFPALTAAAALGLAVPAFAAHAAAPTEAPAAEAAQPSEALLAKARVLVALTNPPKAMLDVNMRGWEAGIAQGLASNPSVSKLEAQYPGVSAAGIAAARPLAREYSARLVAKTSESKAAVFARRLTDPEMDDAIAFFRSEVGLRLVGRLITNADPGSVAKELVANTIETGKIGISADAVHKIERDATRATMAQTSADDQIALMRFGQKPVSAKLGSAGAEADVITLEVVNHPDPEWLRQQTEAVNNAMLAFIDARKK
jgi:hypothetical protein